jgi:hypothetical protein
VANVIRLTIGVLAVVMLMACDSKATSQAPSKGWGVATVVPSSQTTPVSSVGAGELFKIIAMPDGNAYRLNSQTGEIALVTEKGLTTLPINARTQLSIGGIYILENGQEVAYTGDQKFGSAVDALVKKYTK